ncbi:Gp138 family membrane-puncturing spike protein [Salibacterium qingdaonense]|uniref:Phage protein Gp138 N-terminal domain-containing protein n=1 Tax=Salibacterium qingdaonense TaxID=266892 RepID=A0A1I4KRB6_9BACI|nr:Gp138 family membrane-puncturing spike protein [Salibacterium qingdaonense]SFL81079.1 hypothetical protein SAMN04488054_105168 [Salibacterium qingdaonense]
MRGDSYLKQFISSHLLDLHTAMPCRVESFAAGKAELQPLFKRKEKGKEAESYPPILEAHALSQRFIIKDKYVSSVSSEHALSYTEEEIEREVTPVYKKGDIVYVVFAERALDNVISGSEADPEFSRHHALEDAVIVGLIQ